MKITATITATATIATTAAAAAAANVADTPTTVPVPPAIPVPITPGANAPIVATGVAITDIITVVTVTIAEK